MFKLTNSQLNIWNIQQYLKNTNACNICASCLIKENVDINLLKQAVVRFVQINDSLHLRLTIKNGEPMQYVADDSDYCTDDIPTVELSNLNQLQPFESEFVQGIFSLLNSRLFEMVITNFPNGYAAVVLKLHHIITDSWSMGITVQEIVKIYHCLLLKKEYVPDTISYLDYITSEQTYVNSKNFQKDKIFWKNYLQNTPTPVALPSSTNDFLDSPAGSRLTFYFDKQMMNRINEMCSHFNISNYVFFMSIISLFLANAGNTNDVLIGTPILNRSNFKEKRCTGMFVTTVPFRTHISGNTCFSEFLETNRSTLTSILRHQKYPYNQLITNLSEQNDQISHLYNVAVSYQITKAVSRSIGDYETDWTFSGTCMNDVSITLYDLNDTGTLKIDYDFVNSK